MHLKPTVLSSWLSVEAPIVVNFEDPLEKVKVNHFFKLVTNLAVSASS